MGVNCSCFSICKALGGARLAEKFTEQFRPFFLFIMKRLVLSLFALVCATVSFAQQNLVATLTHGDEVSMFYGAYAYRDAMNAAVDGDFINLSGGSFQACNITKAVAVRGAGVEAALPTFIVNEFEIQIPTTTTERLTMEGLRLPSMVIRDTLQNAYFIKCNIAKVYAYKNSVNKNSLFVDCIISRIDLNLTQGSNTSSSMQLTNCLLLNYECNKSTHTTNFINCVIVDGLSQSKLHCCSLLNCILVNTGSYTYSLPSTASATNCLAVGKNCFGSISAGVNNKYTAELAVFTDSDYTKELNDEAKAAFLGTDGTQVGMYGGPMPFSLTPTYPQITKMEVASKTTADGKLSVNIEVSAAQ